ncbi:ATP-binding protein [Dongia deserti]|uniref:ATP-binding protein n=1 Tax=Dongia deserti TaxID=2268030 RepID=UPI0013C46132
MGKHRGPDAHAGCGNPPDQLEQVFQPFHQVENGLSRNGAGLGLPLTRKLMERHGGTLHVETRSRAGHHGHPPASRRLGSPGWPPDSLAASPKSLEQASYLWVLGALLLCYNAAEPITVRPCIIFTPPRQRSIGAPHADWRSRAWECCCYGSRFGGQSNRSGPVPGRPARKPPVARIAGTTGGRAPP